MADETKPEEKKTENKPTSIWEALFVAFVIIAGIAVVCLLLFGVYAAIAGYMTPETIKTITIKNTIQPDSHSNWAYIEDTDCNVYGTSTPLVYMRAHAGETRTYKIKFFNRVFLSIEPAENKLPLIVEDVTNCK